MKPCRPVLGYWFTELSNQRLRKPLGGVFWLLGLCFAWTPVAAFERLQGTFEVTQSCAASIRIKELESNGVVLAAGEHYALVGENRPGGPFVQIRYRNGPLWVRRACGRVKDERSLQEALQGTQAPEPRAYLLALTWRPGFCSHHPQWNECRLPAKGDQITDQLLLHGLWPQPASEAYCLASDVERQLDQDHQWRKLTPLELDEDLRRGLQKAMPGIISGLDRHEWVKHGRCTGQEANAYFRQALRLLKTLQGSSFARFLLNQQGHTLTLSDLRDAYEMAFGRGTGTNLLLVCLRQGPDALITELRIQLQGQFGQLQFEQASPAARDRPVCQAGRL